MRGDPGRGWAIVLATTVLATTVLASIVLAAPSGARAQSFDGVVHDARGMAVEGATVSVDVAARGTSGVDGTFSIATGRTGTEDILVAARAGYLSDRLMLLASSPSTGIDLVLEDYPADQDGFIPEGPYRCRECHGSYGRGWSGIGGHTGSAHADSALNPRVLDIWRGTASGRTDAESCASAGGTWRAITDIRGTTVSRCYLGVGLLPDMNPQCGHEGQPACDDHAAAAESRPDEWSDCAGCHTPGAAIRIPEELDLDFAEVDPIGGSVTCAACHRIAEVFDPNAPGVLVGARVLRGEAAAFLPVGLGPMDDAAGDRMAAGYAPHFATSLLCAPCHQDTFTAEGMSPRWAATGVPSEQTYAEWAESPYASGVRERHCQGCHMPTIEELGIEPVIPAIAGDGPDRHASEMHAHDFSPLTDAESRAGALAISVEAVREGDAIAVSASVTNRGVAHGFPSGVTSRNALLVITAEVGGQRLVEIDGDVLPHYAGRLDHGTVELAGGGATITVDHPIDGALVGRELRMWRTTTEPHEHQSFGLLRGLPLAERGLLRARSLGRYRIVAVRGADIDLDPAPPIDAADLDGAEWAIGDEDRLAGVAGLGFAKVNVAADGTTDVPFWRATDILWDNRIAPDETQRSQHRFAIPAGASGEVTIRARLLYRRSFVELALQRGWEGNEDVAGEATAAVDLGGAPDAGPIDLDAGTPDAGGPEPGASSCSCTVAGRGRGARALGTLAVAALIVSRLLARRRSRR